MAEKQVRVAVMGSGGVGKTSIIIRFGKNEFSQEWIPTLEDHFEAELSHKGMMYKLDIVDTAGQDELAAVVDMSIQGANVYICVCSVASRVTFDEIDTHIDRANKNDPTGKAKIVMVGNKCDLTDGRVPLEDLQAKAAQYGCPYIECSAATGSNIQDVFMKAVELFVDSGSKGKAKGKSKEEGGGGGGGCCEVA